MKGFTEIRQRSLINRSLLNFILWILICGMLSGVFFAIDYLDGTSVGEIDGWRLYSYSPYTWAPEASISIAILAFNLAAADVGYHIIKRHGRNTVRWTTAIIVFSPFLAAIAYFLTWPKNQ